MLGTVAIERKISGDLMGRLANSRWRTLLLVGVPLVVGLVHVWVVSHRYAVGSFDDDGSYLMSAIAMAHGGSLDARVPSGTTVAGLYPPGYPFLLVPLVFLWPHTFTPERLLSAVAYAALFPLLWVYLGRRKVGDGVRFGALILLAASPVLATYGSMVMAEAPFLVLLLALLLVTERWRPGRASRTLGIRGIGVVVMAAGLVWLKEAGIGILLGLALWYLLHKDVRKTLAILVGFVVLLSPVLLARHLGGVPLAGQRYTQQLGSFYQGDPILTSLRAFPSGFVRYFKHALPETIVSLGHPPLPIGQAWRVLSAILSWQFSILTVLGLGIAARRHRDAAVVAISVYILETMVYPDVNQRRVILILPLIVSWYVLGLVTALRWVGARLEARRAAAAAEPRATAVVGGGTLTPVTSTGLPLRLLGARSHPAAVFGLVLAVLIAVPVVLEFPRDYLYGHHSSHPGGSRYMAILAAASPPSTPVETDYLSTTGLFSGHVTAKGVYFSQPTPDCDVSAFREAVKLDHAGFLLTGGLNRPGELDNVCVYTIAAANPSFAVPLLHTSEDRASVFEFIGPGTAHPDLSDLVTKARVSSSAPLATPRPAELASGVVGRPQAVVMPVAGTGEITWKWGGAEVSQVSIGEVKPSGAGAMSGSALQVQRADGRWTTVADVPGSIGDGGAGPYLFAQLPTGTRLQAMRLVVRANGPVTVKDFHALGIRA